MNNKTKQIYNKVEQSYITILLDIQFYLLKMSVTLVFILILVLGLTGMSLK